jgi:hypothetical protein
LDTTPECTPVWPAPARLRPALARPSACRRAPRPSAPQPRSARGSAACAALACSSRALAAHAASKPGVGFTPRVRARMVRELAHRGARATAERSRRAGLLARRRRRRVRCPRPAPHHWAGVAGQISAMVRQKMPVNPQRRASAPKNHIGAHCARAGAVASAHSDQRGCKDRQRLTWTRMAHRASQNPLVQCGTGDPEAWGAWGVACLRRMGGGLSLPPRTLKGICTGCLDLPRRLIPKSMYRPLNVKC